MTTASQQSVIVKWVVRIVALIAIIAAATWLAHEFREAFDVRITPANETQVHNAIMFGSVAYIGLLAVPFVPGAEIGLAMLAALGARIAPLIYVATVASMMLAFMLGKFLPVETLQNALFQLRLRKAAALIRKAAPLSGEERLAMLLNGQPKRALAKTIRFRYLALALAVNTPGNSLIGGGGGIMMVAGLSGIFSPIWTLITVAIAVAPVPVAIMFFNFQI